jgi:hypothetical protein
MMESLELLNKRLTDLYGKFETGASNYRLAFSDQLELQVGRFNIFTENGIYLRTEQGVRDVPKYPFIKPPKWILERCVPVSTDEALKLTTKTSYEPLWVFGKYGDPNGEAIDPTWEAIEFILHISQGEKPIIKDTETAEDADKRIAKLYEELFGECSDVADALFYQQGIVVPHNYNKE